MKKSVLFLLTFSLLLTFSIYTIYAQENVSFIDESAQLSSDEGLTPDSALYVFDGFFDRFGDEIKVREEKIAELKVMIKEGKIEEAKIALERYIQYAESLEKEVSPEQKDEARRSAAAIYNALKEIENEIPEENKKEFFDDIIDQEKSIVTSSEIASKIKELCESLSKIDPLEYSRVCRTQEDAPDWQKTLDQDLTAEQRVEAEKFGKIMSQCFETAGQQCECGEIPFKEFAEMCSIAAPLATACEIEGDEAACEKLDNLEMPELPEHLQNVFDSLEREVSNSQFELHIPRECREAGATSPKECMRIMIQTNAPEECRKALTDANVQNEREAREICEKIMFEQNAPQECIDAGLTDHRECGKLMFKTNAPQECIDAGITGENRNDPKKCEEIMRSQGFEGGPGTGKPGLGPRGFGGNCREITNAEERLKCYDGAVGGVKEHQKNFQERFKQDQELMKQCAQSCLTQGRPWFFQDGSCECGERQEFDDSPFKQDFRPQQEFVPPEGFVPPQGENFVPPENFIPPSEETQSQTTEPSTTEQTSEPTLTGNVVNNEFYNYYFR